MKKNIGRLCFVSFLFLWMILLLIRSDVYLPSVSNGLHLYVTCVLPSMLPFFFFSKLLTELNFAVDISSFLGKPVSKLYNVPDFSAYILIMSMLCGYPIGAKLLSEFYQGGMMDKKEAKQIASFTSNCGPIFIVGTVGTAMFQNKTIGFIILISHYLGSLLNGFIYRKKDFTKKSIPLPGWAGGDILNKSMYNTFLSVGQVGGFIVLFNVLCDVIQNAVLAWLPASDTVKNFLSAFILGLIEMTRGCYIFSQTSFPLYVLVPCCTFLVTFGGLSVTIQSLSFLSSIKISPAFYFVTKLTQGILSCGLSVLFLFLFGL